MFKLSTLAVASLSLGVNAFAPSTSGIARAPTALRVAEIPVIDEEEEIPVIDEAVPVSSRSTAAPALLAVLAIQLRFLSLASPHTLHYMSAPSTSQLLSRALPGQPRPVGLNSIALAGDRG